MRKPFFFLAVLSILLSSPVGPVGFASPRPSEKSTKADGLLTILEKELHRASTELGKSNPAPYFVSYSAHDLNLVALVGTNGGLLTSINARRRGVDVTMRVGSSALDNTHGESRESGMTSGILPLEDDPDAATQILWQLTDREYQRASAAFLKVQNDAAVKTKEEDTSPDFSQQSPQGFVDPGAAAYRVDLPALQDRVRRLSFLFRRYPDVLQSVVFLQVQDGRSYFVSSEGSRISTPGGIARMYIQAETRAGDGMELFRAESFQAGTPDQLPADSVLEARIEKIAADLHALRAAPVVEPFDGPAILSGRAAAVFFHEVLGHRLEGHRQRDEEEGQTFTKKVNELILPEFLSVVDDPTRREMNGVSLSGFYRFDEEGEPASRVELVQSGILKNFLLSRMPITHFNESNGHGRGQPGLMPTGRQGSLIVTSSKTVPEAELRGKLIDEIKKQGKPYGLYFEDVQGGFTLTTRNTPQAFQIFPIIVWRVYADGRPDELVRGVDLIGTPLLALRHIAVTGDKLDVFNGICGAESGSVPVSAVAPAMLFSEMEIQKRPHSHDRPPILPAPSEESTAPGNAAKPPAEKSKP